MTTPRSSDFGHIVFFTGAGLSTESDITNCRGHGGICNELELKLREALRRRGP